MASKVCDGCNPSASRAERIIKRLVIALIVIIALTFASNIGWLIYANNNGNTNSSYPVTQSGGPTSIIGDGNNRVTPQETPTKAS